ncbi:MAG: alpha/beta hydrolase [Phycisphaerales bacterium JB040]
MLTIRSVLSACAIAVLSGIAGAQGTPTGYTWRHDVPYRTPEEHASDGYLDAQCRVDLQIPEGIEGFPTIVWLHAGGLTGGDEWVPEALQQKGIAVVGVGYRLSPRVEARVCIEDAAAAVAWVLDHCEEWGGDPEKVVVSGHSAGGYLASMVGLDPSWLEPFGHHPHELAGLAPVSGHTITHFTVRAERGLSGTDVVVDGLAPIAHLDPEAPPIYLITAGRDTELLGRYEENAYFWRMMREVGHPDCTITEIEHTDHGSVVEPALPLVLQFTRRVTGG